MAQTQGVKGVPRAVVDDVYLAPVHISAGGTIYTTTLTTLTKYPESKLAQLFNGTLAITLDPVNRHYFLDVDGSVFTHILNFLRYDKLVLPEDFNQIPLLKEQIQFFELKEMMSALTQSEGGDTEEEDETGDEKVKLRQRRKKRRTASRQVKEKLREERDCEMATGDEEGETETEGRNDVVVMDTTYGTYCGPPTIAIHSSAELILEEPVPGYKGLQPANVTVVHSVTYRFPYDSRGYTNPTDFNPCIIKFTKQLLDKGYKLSAVARTDKEYDYNKYVFTRAK